MPNNTCFQDRHFRPSRASTCRQTTEWDWQSDWANRASGGSR
uniref:Uncharacterized protein n=1 Tax=Rhizophora mucronata TaxID=61149 RepID=A0A2P2NNB2_RHIMU